MVGPRFNINTEPYLGVARESIEYSRFIGGKNYTFSRTVWEPGTVVILAVLAGHAVHRFEGVAD